MINNELFLESLIDQGISFFSGVPDSLLKEICACITEKMPEDKHVITANEGGAVALATGYHLATGGVPLIYLQNSGLGNIVNPLLSLADPEVYSIPMIVMIGWRGEPGVKDEPQHVKQGRVQNALLDAMEIPYYEINAESIDYKDIISKVVATAISNNSPVALIVRKGTFEPYKKIEEKSVELLMSREEAIQTIVKSLDDSDIVVSTTGMPSREIFEIRANDNMGHHRDFLTVGCMGHCSQIALGVAMNTNRSVYCIDGDGAFLMHMGSVAITGTTKVSNMKHIVLNNAAHDSVGGQPTVGFKISIPGVAKASGYNEAKTVSTKDELLNELEWMRISDGPILLEVIIKKGSRKDLGRPTRSPIENKIDLMKNLGSVE